MMGREFDRFDREVKQREAKLAREQAQAIKERGRIVAAAEKEASQKRLEAVLATSNRISDAASMLPRYGRIGAITGAALGRRGGSGAMVAAATVGAVGGLAVDAGSRAVQYGFDQVNEASRVEQAGLKFKVVFEEFADSVQEEVDAFAQKSSRSRYQLRSAAADFMGMIEATGVEGGQAAKMSSRLAMLSTDLASFHNLREDETQVKLMAGMSGETEPLRRLGVDVREAAVQAKALSMGLAETKNELTQADKMAARFAIILEQTSKAHGDAERSLGSYESSQRRYEAVLQEFNVTLGQALMPATKELNEYLINLVKQFSMTGEEAEVLGQTIKSMLIEAIDVADGATFGAGGLITSTGKAYHDEAKVNAEVRKRDQEMMAADPKAFRRFKAAQEKLDALPEAPDGTVAQTAQGAQVIYQRMQAKKELDAARKEAVAATMRKSRADKTEADRRSSLVGLGDQLAGLRDTSRDGAGMTKSGGQLSAAQQTQNNWDFLSSIGDSIKSGIDAVGDDLAGKVRRGRFSRMSKPWNKEKKQSPFEPRGGGDHIAVDQLTQTIQSNLFRAADETRRKKAEEAAIKSAEKAAEIAKHTERAAAKLDALPTTLAKFFGYGK